jgi:hypothetical protein
MHRVAENRRRREQSRQTELQDRATAAQGRHIPLEENHGQQMQQKRGKKNSTQARRERKEKQRAKKIAAGDDAMEIG